MLDPHAPATIPTPAEVDRALDEIDERDVATGVVLRYLVASARSTDALVSAAGQAFGEMAASGPLGLAKLLGL